MPPENKTAPLATTTSPIPQSTVPVGNPAMINPMQQPNETNQMPKSGSKIKLILVILVVIVILAAVGVGGFLYLRSQQKSSSPISTVKQPPTTAKSSSQSATTQTSAAGDPLALFINNLSAGDFQIKTSGKIVINANESMDFTNGVFYLKKGQLVRGDFISQGNPGITIISNNTMYSLDPVKKTYFLGNDASQPLLNSPVYSAFKQSSILLPFLDDDKSKAFVWQKTGENEYQTKWTHKFSAFDTGNGQTADIKVVLDPKSGSVLTFSVMLPGGQWQTVTFSYDTAPNIDSLLVIPADYKKAF